MSRPILFAAALALATPAAADPGVPGMVSAAAQRHGVPASLALGVAKIESGFRCSARNHGSYGVMQVKPQTARSVGVYGSLFDCRTNIEAGVRYLKIALQRGGAGCAGLALYNRGVYARPVCTAYGAKALRAARAF